MTKPAKDPEVPPAEGTALTAPGTDQGAILDLIAKATERGVSADVLEKFQSMWERSRDDARNQAIGSALVAFQAEVPMIPRTDKGLYGPYAKLEKIERVIRPLLTRHRLAFRWTSEPDAGGMILFCHLMHADGGEKVAKVRLPGDEGNRGQKPYLAMGGVMTYGKRLTLIEVLGLTTCDDDAAPPDTSEPITESQAADLRALAAEVGVTEDRICEKAGVKSLDEFPAAKFSSLVAALEKRRATGGGPG